MSASPLVPVLLLLSSGTAGRGAAHCSTLYPTSNTVLSTCIQTVWIEKVYFTIRLNICSMGVALHSSSTFLKARPPSGANVLICQHFVPRINSLKQSESPSHNVYCYAWYLPYWLCPNWFLMVFHRILVPGSLYQVYSFGLPPLRIQVSRCDTKGDSKGYPLLSTGQTLKQMANDSSLTNTWSENCALNVYSICVIQFKSWIIYAVCHLYT